MLAEAVPAAGLVGVVKHRVAEGTFVAFFQLLHKLVLCVGLKVQGNGVARVLADEGTGDNRLLLRMSHSGESGGTLQCKMTTQTTAATIAWVIISNHYNHYVRTLTTSCHGGVGCGGCAC